MVFDFLKCKRFAVLLKHLFKSLELTTKETKGVELLVEESVYYFSITSAYNKPFIKPIR